MSYLVKQLDLEIQRLKDENEEILEHVREIRDLAMQDKSSEIIKLIESKTLKLLK